MYQELFEFAPGREGFYGEFGGAYIPEILHETLAELSAAFTAARRDPTFWNEYVAVMQSYSCRPTPISYLENLTRICGGARLYAKREDLNQTGAHKANNVMGQGLLVKRMGKKRVIAETGAGQHGVATATMAARLGLECTIYMGAEDVKRQRPNVFWMEQLGATVVGVEDGTKTLKDAINACMRDWVASMANTHYVLGTVCGAHPFPQIVTYFQSIIGMEAREQMLAMTGKLPDRVYACVGGGSNASGVFAGFLDDTDVELIGVEAGGHGVNTGQHAARIAGGGGIPGVAQGYKTYFLQNDEGQMNDTHSVSAGLDYVGVGPILAHLHSVGRVRFEAATDREVIDAFRLTVKNEGLIPALESTHALVTALKEARKLDAEQALLVNISGRGDKDIFTIAEALPGRRLARLSSCQSSRVRRARRKGLTMSDSLQNDIRERLRERSPLLMTHAVAGYPSVDANRTMLKIMDEVGVDLVELQLPFSEPIADGPAFVRANQGAIEGGMNWESYFDLLTDASERHQFATLFMGYYNSIYRMGEDTFLRRLETAGARGFIIADLPPEEAPALEKSARDRGLSPVVLMTPTNTDARLRSLAAHASGLVYCVARKGVTGTQTDVGSDLVDFLSRCRQTTKTPLAVGFGIKTPDDVRALRGVADIAIVGTACLEAWERGGEGAYREFLTAMAAATQD